MRIPNARRRRRQRDSQLPRLHRRPHRPASGSNINIFKYKASKNMKKFFQIYMFKISTGIFKNSLNFKITFKKIQNSKIQKLIKI
jgi:hypothetical protein